MDEQIAGCGLRSVLVTTFNSALWAQGLSDKTCMQSGRSLEPNRLHLPVRSLYPPLEETLSSRGQSSYSSKLKLLS